MHDENDVSQPGSCPPRHVAWSKNGRWDPWMAGQLLVMLSERGWKGKGKGRVLDRIALARQGGGRRDELL